jgi:hypothetical protein
MREFLCWLIGHKWRPPWSAPPRTEGVRRTCQRCGCVEVVCEEDTPTEVLWWWEETT